MDKWKTTKQIIDCRNCPCLKYDYGENEDYCGITFDVVVVKQEEIPDNCPLKTQTFTLTLGDAE